MTSTTSCTLGAGAIAARFRQAFARPRDRRFLCVLGEPSVVLRCATALCLGAVFPSTSFSLGCFFALNLGGFPGSLAHVSVHPGGPQLSNFLRSKAKIVEALSATLHLHTQCI